MQSNSVKRLIMVVGMLAIMGIAIHGVAYSDEINLSLSSDGTTVNILWENSVKYEGFNLIYAPYPNPDYVGSIDMGNQTSFAFDVANFSFYIAIQPYNVDMMSNIGFFDCNESSCNVQNQLAANSEFKKIDYFMPIKVGNYVEYKITCPDGTGIPENDVITYNKYTITEVGDSYFIQEETALGLDGYLHLARYELHDDVLKQSQQHLRMDNEKGLYTSESIFDPILTVLPSSMQVGHEEYQQFALLTSAVSETEYLSEPYVFKDTREIKEVTSIEAVESVSVPAGTFEAVKTLVTNIEYSDTFELEQKDYVWYTKEFGEIKQEDLLHKGCITELNSFYFQ